MVVGWMSQPFGAGLTFGGRPSGPGDIPAPPDVHQGQPAEALSGNPLCARVSHDGRESAGELMDPVRLSKPKRLSGDQLRADA